MRYQGRVVSWTDDKGFGFVARNGSDEKLFLHISAVAGGHAPRPRVGDLLTWKEGKDGRGRMRAIDAAYVERHIARVPLASERHERAPGWLPRIAGVIALLVVAGAVWNRADLAGYDLAENATEPEPVRRGAFGVNETIAPLGVDSPNTETFRCEAGKVRCPQMRSCAEAVFYINNCPNTRMDGDSDGIPCEDEHCGH